jgi:DNA-directed RNA polymerase II subunit RPB1
MGTLEIQPGRTMIESFEQLVNKVLNTARDHAGSPQSSLDETNSVKAMVTAGSKGSFINISQIVRVLGSRMEGKRIPYGFKSELFRTFPRTILVPSRVVRRKLILARSLASRILLHAMGGREGLIDTACKTAETGYIQRRWSRPWKQSWRNTTERCEPVTVKSSNFFTEKTVWTPFGLKTKL